MDTKLKLITTLSQGLPQIAVFKSQFSYNIDVSELLLVAGEKNYNPVGWHSQPL